MPVAPSLFDPARHEEVVSRLRALTPDSARRWGRMTAPQMVTHLTDQMTHTLGDVPCTPVPSVLRLPPAKYLAIYVIPWPRGRITGPPDAFVTQPGEWEADRTRLVDLVDRFVALGPEGAWPRHALFGPMSGRDWGVFCYKHFNHHLTQFGV